MAGDVREHTRIVRERTRIHTAQWSPTVVDEWDDVDFRITHAIADGAPVVYFTKETYVPGTGTVSREIAFRVSEIIAWEPIPRE